MEKRKEIIDEEELAMVDGGALRMRYTQGKEFGTVTSTVTGQTYSFSAVNLDAVGTIVAQSGISEADKVQMLQQYFV